MSHFTKFVILALSLLIPTLSAAQSSSSSGERIQNEGVDFLTSLQRLPLKIREQKILKAVEDGMYPKFLDDLISVDIVENISGKDVKATIWVTADYFSVGSNSGFAHIPMTPVLAQKIADHKGLILPTTKIVREIHATSDITKAPRPIPPHNRMSSIEAFLEHDSLVGIQSHTFYDQLISGTKKDIVISNRLEAEPTKVAIYGWIRPNGKPIQPLSTVHDQLYADYSHGVRFVSKYMLVDGVLHCTEDVLKDPKLSKLLSDEGSLRLTRIPGIDDLEVAAK